MDQEKYYSGKVLCNEIDRSVMLKHRPGIIWLTGLSGSGKSTIAKGVEKKLFSEHLMFLFRWRQHKVRFK